MTRGSRPWVAWLLVALGAGAVAAVALAPAAAARASTQNDRCFACHERTGLGTVDVNGEQKSLTVGRAAYEASVHSLLDCTSCHVGFKADEHSAEETKDWYSEATLQACGNCHGKEYAMYSSSFHGKLELKDGASGGVPTCGDCHGSHAIIDPHTPAFRTQITQRCEACHGGKATSYLDSYHGKAFQLGRPDAATCPDCHGGHQILPAADPASTISSQHIVATCQKCHPGANASFASYRVHAVPSSPHSGWVIFSVNLFYIVLIAVVFTFGGVHSVLYFVRGRRLGLYRRAHE